MLRTAWRRLQSSLAHDATYKQVIIIAVSSNLSDRWVQALKCPRHAEGVAALNCRRKTQT